MTLCRDKRLRHSGHQTRTSKWVGRFRYGLLQKEAGNGKNSVNLEARSKSCNNESNTNELVVKRN
jgi:hypothetical protein